MRARHRPDEVAAALRAVVEGPAAIDERTGVVAELDDGQRLRGLNEIVVGDRGHRSAGYLLRTPDGAQHLDPTVASDQPSCSPRAVRPTG